MIQRVNDLPKARRPPSRLVESKRRARRARILDSAVRAFARRGFYGTSMEDIARELRLSRASVYYYFRDKEEILARCHLEALGAVLEVLARVKDEGMPPAQALRCLIQEHVKVMVGRFHGTALALDIDALGPTRRVEVVALRDRYEQGLREVIARGVSSGAFRPVDPKLAAFAIFGAINWISRWYRQGGKASTEEVAASFAQLFLDSLERR